jgi:hypothetical protein
VIGVDRDNRLRRVLSGGFGGPMSKEITSMACERDFPRSLKNRPAVAAVLHPLLGLQAGHVQPPDLLQKALPRRVRTRQLVLELLDLALRPLP